MVGDEFGDAGLLFGHVGVNLALALLLHALLEQGLEAGVFAEQFHQSVLSLLLIVEVVDAGDEGLAQFFLSLPVVVGVVGHAEVDFLEGVVGDGDDEVGGVDGHLFGLDVLLLVPCDAAVGAAKGEVVGQVFRHPYPVADLYAAIDVSVAAIDEVGGGLHLRDIDGEAVVVRACRRQAEGQQREAYLCPFHGNWCFGVVAGACGRPGECPI